MATSSLNINYEETRKAGNSIKNSAGSFKSLLGDISKLNEDLKNSWKGSDADSYTAKITEQAATMNKLQKTLDDMGAYLVSVGDAYEKAMSENTLK